MASKERPSHHGSDGRFRNPWPGVQAIRSLAVLRWMWERARAGRLTLAPLGTPPERVRSAFISPRLATNDVCVTWFGHSTFLLQFGGVNVLTDPMFSMRASPLSWLGPRRLQSRVIAVDALPPIDVILLSHDHYDHFDDASIRALARRFPAAAWCVPLGVAARLRARGVRGISECDWWDRAQPLPSVHLLCLPAISPAETRSTATAPSGADGPSPLERAASASWATALCTPSSDAWAGRAGRSISC